MRAACSLTVGGGGGTGSEGVSREGCIWGSRECVCVCFQDVCVSRGCTPLDQEADTLWVHRHTPPPPPTQRQIHPPGPIGRHSLRPRGKHLPRPRGRHPYPCGQANICENITLSQTSFAGGKNPYVSKVILIKLTNI